MQCFPSSCCLLEYHRKTTPAENGNVHVEDKPAIIHTNDSPVMCKPGGREFAATPTGLLFCTFSFKCGFAAAELIQTTKLALRKHLKAEVTRQPRSLPLGISPASRFQCDASLESLHINDQIWCYAKPCCAKRTDRPSVIVTGRQHFLLTKKRQLHSPRQLLNHSVMMNYGKSLSF